MTGDKDDTTKSNCREYLSDLESVVENRRGSFIIICLYVLSILFVFLLNAYLLEMLSYKVDSRYLVEIFTALGLLYMLFVMAVVTREGKIINQRNIEDFRREIEKYFHTGERFLLMVVALDQNKKMVSWLGDPLLRHRFSYFVFTTDRLIIVTFRHSGSGTGAFRKAIERGQFSSIVNKIYSIPLHIPRNIKFGGVVAPFIMQLTHTKCTVIPEGESEPASWALTDKHTKNAKLLKEIRKRLVEGYSAEF